MCVLLPIDPGAVSRLVSGGADGCVWGVVPPDGGLRGAAGRARGPLAPAQLHTGHLPQPAQHRPDDCSLGNGIIAEVTVGSR